MSMCGVALPERSTTHMIWIINPRLRGNSPNKSRAVIGTYYHLRRCLAWKSGSPYTTACRQNAKRMRVLFENDTPLFDAAIRFSHSSFKHVSNIHPPSPLLSFIAFDCLFVPCCCFHCLTTSSLVSTTLRVLPRYK